MSNKYYIIKTLNNNKKIYYYVILENKKIVSCIPPSVYVGHNTFSSLLKSVKF